MTKRSHTMSTQPAPAPNMTETSVIKHYKKQLIYRQHDVPDPDDKSPQFLNEVSNTKIYDLVEEKKKSEAPPNGKKVRRKRKNKNCRGQFRHEAMELIKLGTTPSHTLCKSKEPLSRLVDNKPPPEPHKDDRSVPQSVPSTQETVIHPPYVTKTILENQKQPQFSHALPQMVADRPRKPEPELLPKTPPMHRPLLPEYHSYPVPLVYPQPLPFRPALPPPPPYPVARSPPRPVPRAPIRPIPIQKSPYAGIHFPFSRQEYELQERKKRKHEEKMVAAIDLTVDGKGTGKHQCHCECGKMYASGRPVTQEVIITVSERDSSQVPSYLRGKMENGMLNVDGQTKQNGVVKATTPVITKVPGRSNTEGKLPPLFLIDDLLAKKQKSPDAKARNEDIPVPIRTEPSRVIVSTKSLEESIPRPKSKDYTVSNIIGDNRRQSVDIDTISISSSSSESVRSPRPKSTGLEKQIPHGKLFYYKNNNSFIRYFDDTQKKLFIDSITSEGGYEKTPLEDKEIIELPKNTNFSFKDNLTVEEYVSEMTLVEKFIPRDFFLFYKFVTGYQICNNNLPVSFLTFLKVYNTNGLKILLERYISSLKQN